MHNLVWWHVKHWCFSLQVVRQTSAPPAAQEAWRPGGAWLSVQLERRLLHAGVFLNILGHYWASSGLMIVFWLFFLFCLVMLLSSRGTRIRPLPVFKPAGSPAANRDAELYAPYRTPPRASSSANSSSSCNSSPTSRYQAWLFLSCIINNHRIKNVV